MCLLSITVEISFANMSQFEFLYVYYLVICLYLLMNLSSWKMVDCGCFGEVNRVGGGF